MVRIIEARFITSAAKPEQAPDHGLIEIGMVGRSNVGKSSLINALCNRRRLAKTSATPGKTRLLNFFEVELREPEASFCLVDLPGYGYAKAGRNAQDAWNEATDRFLSIPERCPIIVHLLDCRHQPTEQDRQMRDWLLTTNRMSITVLTKCDKLSRNQLQKQSKAIQKGFVARPGETWIACSALKKQGFDDLLQALIRALGTLEADSYPASP